MTEPTARSTLQVLQGRLHDFPPRWDGRPVRWSDEALPGRSIIVCRRGRGGGCSAGGDFVCTGCNVVDAPYDVHHGVVDPEPGATITVTRSRRLPSGRTYSRDEQVPAWPLMTLILERCLACGHDQVLELDPDTGEITTAWDLDDSDYGDEGSVPPASETLW